MLAGTAPAPLAGWPGGEALFVVVGATLWGARPPGGICMTCVFAAPPFGGGFGSGRFGAFDISCVPGFFFAAGGGAEAAGLAASFAGSFDASASACWKAPRWESAFDTARGETCEGSLPELAEPAELDVSGLAVGGWLFVSGFCSIDGEEPAAAGRRDAESFAEGGGPKASRLARETTDDDEGEAVAAKGFTCAGSPAGVMMLTLDDGLTTDASGRESAGTGAPQLAQNLPDPTSSDLHFAHVAIADVHARIPRATTQARRQES